MEKYLDNCYLGDVWFPKRAYAEEVILRIKLEVEKNGFVTLKDMYDMCFEKYPCDKYKLIKFGYDFKNDLTDLEICGRDGGFEIKGLPKLKILDEEYNNENILEGKEYLKQWINKGPIEVVIEENNEDIVLKMKYNRYGDDYIIIKTKDGHTYEYGYYLDLKCARWLDDDFITKPIEGKRAGKMEEEPNGRITGDEIEYIIYKNKSLDIDNVRMKHFYDEWGTEMFDISLRQFK